MSCAPGVCETSGASFLWAMIDLPIALTSLGQLHSTIERDQLTSPCVIVVGDVVRGVAAARAPEALRRIA